MTKALTAGLATIGLLFGAATVRADTALVIMTPQKLKDNAFKLTTKAARDHAVEFVITRDIKGIDGPGRAGYLWDKAAERNGLGTRVKLEERDDTLTFRFTVPEEKVASSVFTLWGQGIRGEGITFEFQLDQFRKTKKD
jgi:hypothetical protein